MQAVMHEELSVLNLIALDAKDAFTLKGALSMLVDFEIALILGEMQKHHMLESLVIKFRFSAVILSYFSTNAIGAN